MTDDRWTNIDDDDDIPEDDSPVMLAKKDYADTEMDITPMIDITFLLLIFFLVASKMQESADVDLPNADYGMAVPEQVSVVVIVKNLGDSKSQVCNGKGDPFSDDLEAQEIEVADYVARELEANQDLLHVMLKGEKGVKHGEIARVAEAMSTGIRQASKDEEITTIDIAVLEE